MTVTVTDVSEGFTPADHFCGGHQRQREPDHGLTVTATDPDDTTPPPIGGGGTADIPLTWDDPRFNATVINGKATVSNGQNLSNKSYAEQSGDPTITCQGNNVD